MLRRFIVCVAMTLCLTLLWGCTANEATPEDTKQTGLEQVEPTAENVMTESMDSVNMLQSERLQASAWDSGRTNETSGNALWETEAGYYYVSRGLLYYADKVDLSLWIPVCSKADCLHTGNGTCDATILSEMLMKDDRIIFNTDDKSTAALASYDFKGEFLASMALDGTDKQLLYHIPEFETRINAATYGQRSILLSEYFVHNLITLNETGTYDAYVYIVDENGPKLVSQRVVDEMRLTVLSARQAGIYGDAGFFTSLIDGDFNIVYRFVDQELIADDLSDLPQVGSYLDGDTLQIFRTGDGYYRVDLTTREETKLSDAQLENSVAHIILPNCILESTLLGDESLALRENVQEHSMRMFDGEKWQEVILPEEFADISEKELLRPVAVASDRIFLILQDLNGSPWLNPLQLYQILLTTDTPTLEYLGPIG